MDQTSSSPNDQRHIVGRPALKSKPSVDQRTQTFNDGEVCLHIVDWSMRRVHFLKHVPTFLIKNTVDTSQSLLWRLDLNKIYRLKEPWLGSQLGSIDDPPSSGNDLTTSSVDGISMKNHITDFKANTPHVFFCHCKLNTGWFC
ncbi:unnamed protein product, partial [Prunus brigantina]